jgi:hypothetical protein
MKRKVFIFIILIISASCAGPIAEIREVEIESTPTQKPLWVNEPLKHENGFIFATGRSRSKPTIEEAKEEALIEAMDKIVRYTGVTVEAFSRSVEASSIEEGKEYYSADFERKNRIRAKAFVKRSTPVDWYIQKIRRLQGKKKLGDYYKASIYLKVSENEIERIQDEKNIRLSLDIGLYYEDEDGKLQYLTEGTVLHSGDSYALYVKPNDCCYLYVFQVDDLGNSFLLFPNEAYNTTKNPLTAGKDYWIPNTEQYLVLDETTGKERFYIFASFDRIGELESNNKLLQADMDRVIKAMGVAGVKNKVNPYDVEPPRKRIHAAEVKKKLQAEGAFVYETWFWHR